MKGLISGLQVEVGSLKTSVGERDAKIAALEEFKKQMG
jgi:hypothetical protein